MLRRWTVSVRSAVALLCLAVLWVSGVWARTAVDPVDARSGLPVIALSALPAPSQEIWSQIHRGGPFRYEKDGTTFFNRERLLPRENRGYDREYTVPTPGLTHRGARRIVCGGWKPAAPEACYYTADHYSSFKKIVQ